MLGVELIPMYIIELFEKQINGPQWISMSYYFVLKIVVYKYIYFVLIAASQWRHNKRDIV